MSRSCAILSSTKMSRCFLLAGELVANGITGSSPDHAPASGSWACFFADIWNQMRVSVSECLSGPRRYASSFIAKSPWVTVESSRMRRCIGSASGLNDSAWEVERDASVWRRLQARHQDLRLVKPRNFTIWYASEK
eukprot:scaffold18784_cov112-Isochrysis_galbana.AAC.3